MRRAALRFARQRAALIRRVGGRIDSLYAGDLVQDALADTWMGTVAWDPRRCSLLEHVRSLVRTRSWRDLCGAVARPHESHDAGDSFAGLKLHEAQRHATTGNLSPIVLAGLTVRVARDLRDAAKGDPAATAILAAWIDGYVERDEVIAHTGLSIKDYKAARARLTYLVQDLPQSLHESVCTLLRSAS